MNQSNAFQNVIMRLQQFWAEQGLVMWQPYNVQVGAGTLNPATALRVLGPEPWNVGYVEPSIRPDDGRFGDNPNRMQMHFQYQVILKPDPGNPQEIYLQSLEAIGIDRNKHDIRFVEDNWESPALGAWGLGWEVWLDGQEITQFTYFQQAGGQNLNPVAVEITYGMDRIVLALQGANAVWEMDWTDDVKYGDILLQSEIEHGHYYFYVADVEALKETYKTYERESQQALAYDPPLVLPAHDYLLKCSHLFNVLDTRGAIGVVERADYFRRMQAQASKIARAYIAQRHQLEYPLLPADWDVDAESGTLTMPAPDQPTIEIGKYPTDPAPFVLEIGTEELPAADLDAAVAQLEELVPAMLDESRLTYESIQIGGTPRRLVVFVGGLNPNQPAEERIERGPPVKVAFDADGNPTKAAEGFARKFGLTAADLQRETVDGGEYVIAAVRDEGRPAYEILTEQLPSLIAALRFDRTIRWNASAVSFSRPIRWLVSLYGEAVVPFTYADVYANRITRGTRLTGSPDLTLSATADYFKTMDKSGILVDPAARRASVVAQIEALAKSVKGTLVDDPDLLDEVINLIEQPTAFLGHFDEADLELPDIVLTTVMKKHQRYFAVTDKNSDLLPVFIAVRNGDDQNLDSVIDGNEHVIRARFADARFFFNQDIQSPLADFLPKLKTLTFQEDLGSYYDKVARLEGLVGRLGGQLGLDDDQLDRAIRAARLAKADLVTTLVVEMTSLQGSMGQIYAQRSGEPDDVSLAIAEHYLPRKAGGALPQSAMGITLALADRLDTLVGLLSVGLAPTGSADPYGLRRAALGLVQILLGHELDLDLRQLVEWVAQAQPIDVDQEAQASVLDFISSRLYVVLRDEGYAHDVVEAVLAEQGHNPYRAHLHVQQLTQRVAGKNWEHTLDAFARCVRITRSQDTVYTLKPAQFTEEVEQGLLAGLEQMQSSLNDSPDVDQFITAFEPVVPAISAFFAPEAEGGVLVMHDTKAIRENRLALLQSIVALASGVADFSHLDGF